MHDEVVGPTILKQFSLPLIIALVIFLHLSHINRQILWNFSNLRYSFCQELHFFLPNYFFFRKLLFLTFELGFIFITMGLLLRKLAHEIFVEIFLFEVNMWLLESKWWGIRFRVFMLRWVWRQCTRLGGWGCWLMFITELCLIDLIWWVYGSNMLWWVDFFNIFIDQIL